jgi:hypothetical protein
VTGSLRDGFRSLGRNPGLVLLLVLVHLVFALAARPLSTRPGPGLAHREASSGMILGFDHDGWMEWPGTPEGPARALGPALLGRGVVLHPALAPALLGLVLLHLLVQAFLTGGVLVVLRAPRGGWTVRALVHGSGFYFGRLLRVGLLSLVATAAVLALDAPFARGVDRLAPETVSEQAALALTLGRYGVLVLALGLVHMVFSHAKVLVVREERLSALLALVSSLGFCARNLGAAVGQYAAVGAGGLAFLALCGALDARLAVAAGRSTLVAPALFGLAVAVRVVLRLGLLASQLELQRARGR